MIQTCKISSETSKIFTFFLIFMNIEFFEFCLKKKKGHKDLTTIEKKIQREESISERRWKKKIAGEEEKKQPDLKAVKETD